MLTRPGISLVDDRLRHLISFVLVTLLCRETTSNASVGVVVDMDAERPKRRFPAEAARFAGQSQGTRLAEPGNQVGRAREPGELDLVALLCSAMLSSAGPPAVFEGRGAPENWIPPLKQHAARGRARVPGVSF
jgi:hypothetical protein